MTQDKNRYWLSWEFPISVDCDPLYQWLDIYDAIECGENVATFISPNTVEYVKKELKKLYKKNSKVRLYLIYKKSDFKIKGEFILGKRKRASWKGYFSFETNEPDYA